MSEESGNDSEVRYRIAAWQEKNGWQIVSKNLTFDEACSQYYDRIKAYGICVLEKDNGINVP